VKLPLAIAAALGLTLAAALLVYYGAASVAEAIARAGWLAVVSITLTHLVSLVLCALAWRVLFLDPPPRATLLAHWARYVRDSLGNLIGIIPATGEIAAARELTLNGVRPGVAGATTVVDLTTELLSQLIFTLMGLLVLLDGSADPATANWLIFGFAVAAIAILGFFIAQKRGLFHFLESLPERLDMTRPWNTLPENEALHPRIEEIYEHTWRVPASVALHLLAWLAGALETWVALHFLGRTTSFLDCVALESLVFAARTTAFFVPWAAGVQEGGYILIGGLLGINAPVALALSLLKRARELITGAPGVIAWQAIESRRLLRAKNKANGE
jgi:putative membrane protein